VGLAEYGIYESEDEKGRDEIPTAGLHTVPLPKPLKKPGTASSSRFGKAARRSRETVIEA
jgi:hypothetical protein